MRKNIRTIALYLPQFHPIPENDEWWGKGFTDWTNVNKAVPLFEGHYQPHEPAESGCYNLMDPDIRENQAMLARDYGIDGFCYYHYWFNGKRLLNAPVDSVLSDEKPEFPFCLCWANENWSRSWDGGNREVLIKQNYSFSDDREHIQFLFRFFSDPRYIKVDGKPLFIVYNPGLLPDIKRTLEIWREHARSSGAGELYLCFFENGRQLKKDEIDAFDSAIEFQPCWNKLPERNFIRRILNRLRLRKYLFVLDYEKIARRMIKLSGSERYKRYPCIVPMWDNTPRKGFGGVVFKDSTPEKYGDWLRAIIKKFRPYSPDENFIFINAWNEWGEGNHLEPCRKWGRRYLEVTKSVLESQDQL